MKDKQSRFLKRPVYIIAVSTFIILFAYLSYMEPIKLALIHSAVMAALLPNIWVLAKIASEAREKSEIASLALPQESRIIRILNFAGSDALINRDTGNPMCRFGYKVHLASLAIFFVFGVLFIADYGLGGAVISKFFIRELTGGDSYTHYLIENSVSHALVVYFIFCIPLAAVIGIVSATMLYFNKAITFGRADVITFYILNLFFSSIYKIVVGGTVAAIMCLGIYLFILAIPNALRFDAIPFFFLIQFFALVKLLSTVSEGLYEIMLVMFPYGLRTK